MLPPALRTGLFAIAALAVLAALVLPKAPPLSLATDVGTTDERVCEALDASAENGTTRLDAAGFPRPSTELVEIYRLSKSNVAEQVIRIDWANHTASCLPTSYAGPVTVNADLSDAAYYTLVRDIRDVVTNGTLHNAWIDSGRLWFGTTITLPQDPGHAGAYAGRLAIWAGFYVATHGGAS